MHVDGCHASIFLFSVGHQEISWAQQCLQVYMKRWCKRSSGLANVYTVLLATGAAQHALPESQRGVWHPLYQTLYRTPKRPAKGKRKKKGPESSPRKYVHRNFQPLEEAVRSLSPCNETTEDINEGSSTGSPSHPSFWLSVSRQLHSLLDSPPWRPQGEHVLVDLHWLSGSGPIPSPSTALHLSDVLLRLKMWHKVHLQIVRCQDSDSEDKNSPFLQEWREVVEARVCTLESWSSGVDTIWRGSLHFTEHRTTMRQVCRQTIVFPGFALTINSEVGQFATAVGSDILKEVGLPVGLAVCPTHLEVVQIIDTTTMPLFWLSPLQCTLSLVNSLHIDSKCALKKLFQKKNAGVLVRLCFSEESRRTAQPKTAADWRSYVQSVDETEIKLRPPPSPLAAYETGPVLLVRPSHQSDAAGKSCDAWFLWRPEYIDSESYQPLQTHPVKLKDNPNAMKLAVPLIKITNENQEETSDPEVLVCDLGSSDSLEELKKRASEFKHETQGVCDTLLLPPSEWPEIEALRTYEWVQRKLVRPVTTPDFMFGQLVAPPPPASAKVCSDAEDVLRCFHESGSPATSDLSPITVSDISEVGRIHNPAAKGTLPSFQSVLRGTPSRKKRYHGVNYCLQPEDSVMDSRLTRIQQRYLISERASNCSSSNTPEVKLEQRRRRRRRKAFESRTQQERAAIVETPKEAKSGHSLTEKEAESSQSAPKTVKGESSRNKGGSSSTTSSDIQLINRRKNPVVNIQRIKTPPSAGMSKVISRILETAVGVKPQVKPQVKTKVKPEVKPQVKEPDERTSCSATTHSFTQPDKLIASQSSSEGGGSTARDTSPVVTGIALSDVTHQLRRSPRKNKWIAGKAEGTAGLSVEAKEAKLDTKTRKRKLEEVIVVALKKKGMSRNHVCFRKCYHRLFTLSKSFLKDLQGTKALIKEMHGVVEFNVSQVIDFELRQAHTTP